MLASDDGIGGQAVLRGDWDGNHNLNEREQDESGEQTE
jgi:hypothetical protein